LGGGEFLLLCENSRRMYSQRRLGESDRRGRKIGVRVLCMTLLRQTTVLVQFKELLAGF
jgi:hypothetical protein